MKTQRQLSATYILILVPCRLAFALFVAVLLNKKHKGLPFYRALYYIPSIIGGSIAVSVVWKQIFGNKGDVMSLLSVFGIEQKVSLPGNPKTAVFVIIIMGVWQFGSSMLIFLSALKQIPESLYESAAIDGANPMKIFWKITMPMLTPTMFFNLILQIINGFRVFTESYVITDGGPMNSTMSYVLYLYRSAFTYMRHKEGKYYGKSFKTKQKRIVFSRLSYIFVGFGVFYTIPLALNMYLDPNSYNNYGGLFAMSVVSLIPIILFFIAFQKYIVEGIATDGIKG